MISLDTEKKNPERNEWSVGANIHLTRTLLNQDRTYPKTLCGDTGDVGVLDSNDDRIEGSDFRSRTEFYVKSLRFIQTLAT